MLYLHTKNYCRWWEGTWRENVETLKIHTLEMAKSLSFAEVISEATGEVWDHSDDESSKDEGKSIHA